MEEDPGKRSPGANYEHKVEQRAMKHREIIHRQNTTSCRSPTRDLDPSWMKTELQRKRQFEFFKRRPVDYTLLLSPVSRHRHSRETLHTTAQVTQSPTSIRRPLIRKPNLKILKGGVNIEKQTVTRSSEKNENGLKTDLWKIPVHTSIQLRMKMKEKVVYNAQPSNSQRSSQTASIQTESGFITVKKADVNQLSDYLVEALQREEALKKKLSGLQKSSSLLLRSTELLWKTRCDEDVLKSKIKALEAQLQVCIKKVPQDGVKRVILKMEKQREQYEQKALCAIQKAQNEMAEAQSKMEYLQGALQSAQVESERWHRLCEELKESLVQLKKKQDEQSDQILQLQGELECSVDQGKMLRKQNESMEQERMELHSCLSDLEEENHELTGCLQELTGSNHDWWNSSAQKDDEAFVLDQIIRPDNSTINELRDTEHRLRVKEKEYKELQADLEGLQQECHGYQFRLNQCREELNTLTVRQSKHTGGCCGRWLCACLFSLLLMLMVLAALWLYHPTARQQLCVFYSELDKCVKAYLKRMAPLPPPAGFTPV